MYVHFYERFAHLNMHSFQIRHNLNRQIIRKMRQTHVYAKTTEFNKKTKPEQMHTKPHRLGGPMQLLTSKQL